MTLSFSIFQFVGLKQVDLSIPKFLTIFLLYPLNNIFRITTIRHKSFNNSKQTLFILQHFEYLVGCYWLELAELEEQLDVMLVYERKGIGQQLIGAFGVVLGLFVHFGERGECGLGLMF
jgi:hypothetical protein